MTTRPADTVSQRPAMMLLASGLEEAKSVAGRIDASGRWPEVIRWCGEAKVLPALGNRLRLCHHTLPPAEGAQLVRGTALQFVETTRCLSEGVRASNLLAAAGIPCAAFKGCAVLAQLYDGPQDRMLQDVDLLIRKADLPAALEHLQSQGYRAGIGADSLEDYLGFIRNSPGAAGNEAMSLRGSAGNSIDLHWKLGSFDTEMLLESAVPTKVLNTVSRMIRPAFGLLLTVHHALRNDFVPREMARDVLDCARWFRLMDENAEEKKVALEQARKCGLEAGLGAMARLVGEFGGARSFGDLAVGGASEALAGLYFHQLDRGAVSTDLNYLVSPVAWRQILTGMISGSKRYVGLMREFEAANGEESLPLVQRVGRLALAAVRTSPKQWRQVRYLAVEKCRLRS